MVFLIGGLEESELFTDFTESAFYSPEGLEATAPVFDKAPELPSPLGQVLVPWWFNGGGMGMLGDWDAEPLQR